MIILGIETSCDETALALIETRNHDGHFECRVIQSMIHSQAELHSAYGGVFPSLAKREHGRNIVPLLDKLLNESADALIDIKGQNREEFRIENLEFREKLESFKKELSGQNPELIQSLVDADFLKNIPRIDFIAVTEGPGLEPALWVGISFAQFLATLWKIPVLPINHMEGHIVGSLLKSDVPHGAWQELSELPSPAIALLISGGHTELVLVDSKTSISSPPAFQYSIIGRTKDDAVGEAFDKVARLLGLPYPGGPHVSKMAHEAYEAKITSAVKLPRPMIASGDLDFSFAGLKTAVLYAVQKAEAKGEFIEDFKKGLAYEFEQAVAETLESKLHKAIEKSGAKAIVIGGGVGANHVLRKRFAAIADEFGIPIFMPSQHISGDNALMIALAGSMHNEEATRPIKAEGTKRLG